MLEGLPAKIPWACVTLSDEEVSLLDDYFQLLCRRMRDQKPLLYSEIVRSLVSTMMLEMLCMMRRDKEQKAQADFLEDNTSGFHRRNKCENLVVTAILRTFATQFKQLSLWQRLRLSVF